MSADREWRPESETGGEGVERPGYEAGGAVSGRGLGGGLEGTEEAARIRRPRGGSERSEQDQWRRFGWVALVILTTGVAWALVLSTILINRSGDRTAELISLFEEGQQQRGGALGQVPQSQEERQAALESQLAADADVPGRGGGCPGESGQGTKRPPARPWPAPAWPRPAPGRQMRRRPWPRRRRTGRMPSSRPCPISLEREQIDLQKKLKTAIEELREAIEDLRPGRPRP